MTRTTSRTRVLSVVVVALVVLGIVALGGACSSSNDTPADVMPPGPEGGGLDADADEAVAPPVTPFTQEAMRAAATAFNAKFCKAYQTCDPVHFTFTYRDDAECMAAGGNMMKTTWTNGSAQRFAAQLAAPYGYGSVLTPDLLLGCARVFSDSDCDAFFRFQYDTIVPAACAATVQGSLPNGSACRHWNQCASGRCISRGPADCGTCIATQPAGAPCQNSYYTCESGTICDNPQAFTGTCKKVGEVGDACDPAALACHSYLICKDGKCARAAPDGSCAVSADCPQHFVICDADHKCTPSVLGSLGDSCFDGVHTGCARELSCALGAPMTPVDAGGDDAATPNIEVRCRPLIADGLSCSPSASFDYPCKTPDSVCLNGTCQQNGPAQCSQPTAAP